MQIEAVQCDLTRAGEADQPDQVTRYRARLEDLIDMATRHGIDVSQRVNPALLPALKD